MNQREARQQMFRASRMYYVDNLTQNDIARELKASRPTISRLLQQARQEGIVEIRIIDPDATLVELEQRLARAFGLVDAVVVNSGSDTPDGARRRVGQAAAGYLARTLQNGNVVGIGWGRSLHEMAQALEPDHQINISVVPLIGGLGQISPMFQVHELARAVGSAFGGSWRSLYAPAIVDSPLLEASLRNSSDLREIAALWNKLDVAVVGIGNVESASEVQMLFVDYLSAATQARLRELDAVGDICVRFFDSRGRLCADAVPGVVGIELKQLRKARRVIGVASGVDKARAVLGALRGRHVNILVADEAAARAALELQEKG